MTPVLSLHAASAHYKKPSYKMDYAPLPELPKIADMHAELKASYDSAMAELTSKYEDAVAAWESKLVKEEEEEEEEEEEVVEVKKFELPTYDYKKYELPSYAPTMEKYTGAIAAAVAEFDKAMDKTYKKP